MEKSYWLFDKGTQGDANFLVGLQKYVIPGALYRPMSAFMDFNQIIIK